MKIFKEILINYFSNLFFYAFFYSIYLSHNFFKAYLYPQTKITLNILFILYLCLGPIYFYIKLKFLKNTEKNSYLLILLLINKIPQLFINLRNEKKIFSLSDFIKKNIDSQTRHVVLITILKFIFFPMMINFVFLNTNSISWMYSNLDTNNIFSINNINFGYFLIATNFLMIFDCVLFAFNYLVNSKLIKNKIKSVDPYFTGWFFALICYEPFFYMTSYLLYKSSPGYSFLLHNSILHLVLNILIFFSWLLYLWADFTLGFKASNLTNRGIVTNGPYKYVRHPAYLAKNMAWWFQTLLFIPTPSLWVVMIITNIIYIMRVLTEERHLLMDKDYVNYVKKTKWRMIPYVF